MASHGIRDKVAIIGMGCTNFGEHWDKSADDMLIDASSAALANAGVTLDDIDAFWLGTMGSGLSGLTLSRPLKIQHKPVTHVENFCATGSEAFRNACYAVASGAYDIAMAIGVEKLKDSGFSGLVVDSVASDGTAATVTAPASFSLLAPAYAKKYGVDRHGAEGGAHPHRLEEPQERRAQPPCAVPQGGLQGDHLVQPDHRRPARDLRLLRRQRRLGGGDHRPRRGCAQVHRQADLREGAVVRRRPGDRSDRSLPTTTPRSTRSCTRPRTRTRRPGSPTRVPSWRWPRSTTASRRPSWC